MITEYSTIGLGVVKSLSFMVIFIVVYQVEFNSFGFDRGWIRDALKAFGVIII